MQVDYKRASGQLSIVNSTGELLARSLTPSHRGAWEPRRPASAVAGAAAGGLGLSYMPYLDKREIEPPRYEMEVYAGASLVKFKPQRSRLSRPGGRVDRRRGAISDFSNRSRSRLMQEVNKLEVGHLVGAYFATLTYPGEFDQWTVKQTKEHLHRFVKAYRRRHLGCAIVWKLEPQRRGAPHYHLLILGIVGPGPGERRGDWLAAERAWIARTWWRIVGSDDPNHLAAGTQFDPVRSYRHARSYLGKYLAKDKHKLCDASPGRFWGVCGPVEKYHGKVVKVQLPSAVSVDLFRHLDKYRHSKARLVRDASRRKVAVGKARRRRADFRSRWYVCPVDQLVRDFLKGVYDVHLE